MTILHFSYFFLHFRMLVDDTRKIATPDSSMMGRPDLQPQPMKVRTRKTDRKSVV